MSSRTKPLIVVEGPDGAGKSTLAHAICEQFGVPYYHHNGPKQIGDEGALAYYTGVICDLRNTGGVMDRLGLTEYVYGKVMRGSSRIAVSQLHQLHELLAAFGGKQIVCMPTLAVCKETWAARVQEGKEMFTDADRFETLHGIYSNMVAHLVLPTYNFKTERTESVIKRLCR